MRASYAIDRRLYTVMVYRNLLPKQTYFAVIKQRTLGTGFFDDACKDFYLRRMLHFQNAFRVQLHAYLLMDKEIFLLFTPLTPEGFYSYCKHLNKSYSRYYRIRFIRSVKAWRDSPVVCRLSSDELILNGQKFVERYMLAISSICHPGEYCYSSYCANAFSRRPGQLKRQRAVQCYIENGVDGLARYREFVATPFREEYERFLQSRLLWGRPIVKQKLLSGLENSRSLTDIDKNGTIADNR